MCRCLLADFSDEHSHDNADPNEGNKFAPYYLTMAGALTLAGAIGFLSIGSKLVSRVRATQKSGVLADQSELSRASFKVSHPP